MNSFNPDSCLRSLTADFETFRSQRRPHERFPDHLRQSVLEAIASGLKSSLVISTLGVTSAQLTLWRKRLKPLAAAENSPRVLNVIASLPGAAIPNGLRVSYEAGRLVLELSF